MKRKVLIYFYNGMVDFEFSFLVALLSTPEYDKQLISVSEDLSPKISKYGISFIPEMRIQDLESIDDVDGLVIPGGISNSISAEFSELIVNLHNRQKLLAAICFGPLFLARANVLHQSRFTTTAIPEVLIEMKLEDPFNWGNYIEQPVVKDRHIITATGSAFIDFSLDIVDYLGLFSNQEEKHQICKMFKNL